MMPVDPEMPVDPTVIRQLSDSYPTVIRQALNAR
jgi:hypothetical protein